jgi:hypothetical protein
MEGKCEAGFWFEAAEWWWSVDAPHPESRHPDDTRLLTARNQSKPTERLRTGAKGWEEKMVGHDETQRTDETRGRLGSCAIQKRRVRPQSTSIMHCLVAGDI